MTNLQPNWGTAIKTAALIAAFFILAHFMDGPSDMQAEEDTAASVRDVAAWHEALTREQAQRPDLWTPERIERAGVAAGMVAQGVTK